MNRELTHLSLFTGIGGLDLAAERAGFSTVGQCEWADYPTKILEKHWPDVPRWRDIRTLTGESFIEKTGLRTVDLISGGFPCQPFSVAGKRRGSEDDRYLWPEMLRVIKELRPRWVVGENVAGIVNMALDQVLSDLEGLGYACQAFVIPACAVDAPHRRDRVCIVANAQRAKWRAGESAGNEPYREDAGWAQAADGGDDVRNTPDKGLPYRAGRTLGEQREKQESERPDRRQAEPGLGGMADGLPHWLDEPVNVPRIAKGIENRVSRLKCLGNAVVPQQFYPVFRGISEIGYRK